VTSQSNAFVCRAQTIPNARTACPASTLYWGDHLRRLNEQAWFYRRTITVPDHSHRRARLHFEGVDYFASVWLNGSLIGQHEGNFAPFTLDVTGLLRPGTENDLIVRVTSPWDTRTPRGNYPIDHVLRGLVKGLYEHGEGVIPPNVNPIGIWRPTWLLLDDGRLDQCASAPPSTARSISASRRRMRSISPGGGRWR
jgi:hypothetical protein